jgi:phosphoglycerol transferase MdoB-like AlkP superfamily enzyme
MQLSHIHKKIGRNAVFAFITTFFLFVILLLLRVNRIYYAFLEFEFKLNSMSHIIYLGLTLLQDFFFVFACYFMARAMLGKTRRKRFVTVASAGVIVIYLAIILYNIIDLIYYKTSGFSISWGVILQSDNVLNLTDSAAVYMTPYLLTVSTAAILLMSLGSVFGTRLVMQIQEKARFRSFLIPRRILMVIIVVMLFFVSQTFLLSFNTAAQINSIPVFNLVTSAVEEIRSDDEVSSQPSGVMDFPGLNRDSTTTPVSIIDRKTQSNIKKKLEKVHKSKKKMNVVVYMTESTYSGYLPMYGAKQNSTPYLSKKSAKSLLFKNCYSTGVRSMNSIVTMLTGLGGNPGFEALTFLNPRIETETVTSMLKKKGYSTALIHAGSFDFYQKLRFLRGRGIDHLVDEAWLGKKYPDAFTYSWGIDDRVMIEEGIDWMGKQVDDKKNFFVTFVPIFPHHPYTLPENIELANPDAKTQFEKYNNSLHYVDQNFERLCTWIKDKGIEKDTLIVFLSDHGEAFGQHKGNYGHQLYVYEENVHIPCIMFNPQLFNTFYEYEGIVNQSDVFATIIDILGLKEPAGNQGESVLRMESGKVAMFGSGHSEVNVGLRDGKYKAIYNFNKNKLKLYDLSTSQYERIDIAGNEPILSVEYKRRLIDWYQGQRNYLKHFNKYQKWIAAANSDSEEYSLLKLEPYFAVQSKYRIRKNVSANESGPLKVKGKTYRKGYGVHSNSCMKFNIKGLGYKMLKGKAAKLEQESSFETFVEMQILVDGKLSFTSGKLTTNDEAVNFSVNIENASHLELLVLDGGDLSYNDNVAWLDPKLIK